MLLKGDNTVVADPDGRLAVNPTGVPALATGGTGDVLTGLTESLLAQGLDPFDAGRLGAWVHGRAAALATPRRPGAGLGRRRRRGRAPAGGVPGCSG